MKQRVEVRSQEEFDACVKIGNIAIVIGCRVVARGNSSVVARENSSVVARENSSVEARENSSVLARGNSSVLARENSSVLARENSSVVALENSSVEARENSSVEARGNSSVLARENSSVLARGNSSVEARGNSSVVAWGNSSVVARENSSVEARENSSVEARGNSSVVARENSSVEARENSSVLARGNVFVRLFSALSIKASAYVAIMKQGDAKTIEGGRILDAMPEPNTGTEWCEYWGIDRNKVEYVVPNIDAAILKQIASKPDSFDMSSWHGDKCDADNWCNTTHCRAGYVICLAGKPGFELERKYGAETAGQMIYAASRPDKELPDFHAADDDALDDIKQSAKQAAA